MNLKSNFSVDALRPNDQLVLRFDFHNLALEAAERIVYADAFEF